MKRYVTFYLLSQAQKQPGSFGENEETSQPKRPANEERPGSLGPWYNLAIPEPKFGQSYPKISKVRINNYF